MPPASAFRFSPSLLMVLDAVDARIVDVNSAFEQWLGYSRSDTVGRIALDLEIWVQPKICALWSRARNERHPGGDAVTLRARDGRILHGFLSMETFAYAGSACVLAIIQNLAEDSENASDKNGLHAVESYRSLFDAAFEGIYRSRPNGGFLDVNSALAQIFGYASPADMLAAPLKRASEVYVDPEQAAMVIDLLDREGRIENVTSRVYRQDGNVIWISENARAVRDAAGNVIMYEGSVVDISDHVLTGARLRQSEELYKTLVDNCRDGVFLIQRGEILFVNAAQAGMLGYSVEEMPRNYMDLVAPESHSEQSQRRESRESGSRDTQEYEVFVLHKNGTHRLMSVSASAIEFNGAIASVGTMHDITDARREQIATAEAERKYRALFENSVTGMFQSGEDGRLIEANDALARILGHADGVALKAVVRYTADLYAQPSDRERIFGELLRSNRIQGMVFNARQRDGSKVLVELNAHVVRDADGKVSYIEGSAQDVTARHAAELALLQSEARFRTLVEHSQVGVYIMRDDRYTYVNQAFAQIVGYSELELIGMAFRRLLAPDAQELVEDRYRKHARGEHVPDGGYETKVRRRDGTLIDIVVSAGRLMIDGALHHAGTIQDVTERRHFERELEHRATHDMLTGLPNRMLFEQRLAEVIANASNNGDVAYAVLFFDLDGFNLINDSLGHASGDRLLVQIADTLRIDLADQVLIARYGGDEFTILPFGTCPRARAVQIAERLLGLLRGRFEVDGHQVYVGASVGVVLGSREYSMPEQMLRDADTAMYRAKSGGKSSYVIFDEEMHAAARTRLKLETDLRLALERREFRIFYQPIVDLSNGLVNGFEALVRWQHPERGLLAPSEFLATADESGMIVAIDWWVLEQVCRQLVQWQRRYPAHAKLIANVNVDERQFADRDVISTLQTILKRTGAQPASLALEVTETVFRHGRETAEATLRALKDFGVSLVVDDFGTGYSSLDSFATSPFDALKIDHSFVRDMVSNFRHRAIVRTIAGFAEDLGLRLTAEGVESQEQVDLLRTLKCTRAQGFLYAPPLPTEEMERILDTGLPLLRHG